MHLCGVRERPTTTDGRVVARPTTTRRRATGIRGASLSETYASLCVVNPDFGRLFGAGGQLWLRDTPVAETAIYD